MDSATQIAASTGAREHAVAQASAATSARLTSIDALRGAIMILMALDHTRDFFHHLAFQFAPDDLRRTTAALFFTRWITHFCAPVFLFTAGLGIYFRLSRTRSLPQVFRFLWTRGLWLMLLEVTVLRLAMNFSLLTGPVLLTVLWVIGLSMVVMSFFLWLPVRVLAMLSVLTIVLHNWFGRAAMNADFGSAAWLWNILYQPGVFRVASAVVIVAYNLIPWLAIMMAGYCFGQLMSAAPETRRKWMLIIGLGITAAFFLVRGLNIYGDPAPWTSQIPGMTLLSFLRASKYPPSLVFILMTLGPAILLLAWFERRAISAKNPIVILGRVPLFYFLGHFFLIHALAVLFALMRYGHARFLFYPLPSAGGPANLYPSDFGYGLPVVYAVWALVVLLMYPACRWFARLRERRKDWWLSYL